MGFQCDHYPGCITPYCKGILSWIWDLTVHGPPLVLKCGGYSQEAIVMLSCFYFISSDNGALSSDQQDCLVRLLMGTFCMTETTYVQKLYKKLEPGEDIAGVVIAVKKVFSPIECFRM